MTQDLTVPPDESEIAALIASLQQFPEHQNVARRMAFQLDILRSAPVKHQSVDEHNAFIDSLTEDIDFEPLKHFLEKMKE